MKLDQAVEVVGQITVAPCAGAWIEIRWFTGFVKSLLVAPCAGAWIEIIHASSLA